MHNNTNGEALARVKPGRVAMSTFLWILAGGVVMSAIALVGSLTLLLSDRTLERVLLPLVALAAGTLLGGALLHMIPAAVDTMGNRFPVYLWVFAGFAAFFALEQFLQWHHCHDVPCEHGIRPLSYLVLIADGLHNFIGGLAVAGAFLIDVRVGISAWLAAAAHEVPQELGDFGILVHSGWSKARALLFNFLSALTFLVGGLIAWAAARSFDVSFLLPFAAGNFLYIAAADLIPEVKHGESLGRAAVHFAAFLFGFLFLLLVRLLMYDRG
jgi:zinc and cadmium transporter